MTPQCEPTEGAEDGSRFWRHVRTDGVYREIGRGLIEATLTKCVIYEDRTGIRWVRPSDEFDDGRFVRCENPNWGYPFFKPDAAQSELTRLRTTIEAQSVTLQDSSAALAVTTARVKVLEAALEDARVTISNTRTNIMSEINRGNDRWEGCPEIFAKKLHEIEAVLNASAGKAGQ